MIVLMMAISACEYSGEHHNRAVWTTSIQTLDASNDVWAEEDEHAECREKHYTDPYTKIEYCLPKGFSNMELIHIYRVEK